MYMPEKHPPYLSVSVVIPTYNRAHYLPQAINSLLSQTRIPNEIIVVNDGSTDDTLQILAPYRSAIIGLSQPNKGPSAARNAGLRYATSDLIALLDSDDTLMPTSIEKRAAALEQNPDFDVVYSNVLLRTMNGEDIGLYTDYLLIPRPTGNTFGAFARYNLMPIHAFMFRRSCLEKSGLFDETLRRAEDYEFWLRMAASHRFLFMDEPLATYHLHSRMITVTERAQMLEDEIEVHERIFRIPAFEQLSLSQKVNFFCTHGTRLASLGRLREARTWYKNAIAIVPLAPRPYLLIGMTLLGKRAFNWFSWIKQRFTSPSFAKSNIFSTTR